MGESVLDFCLLFLFSTVAGGIPNVNAAGKSVLKDWNRFCIWLVVLYAELKEDSQNISSHLLCHSNLPSTWYEFSEREKHLSVCRIHVSPNCFLPCTGSWSLFDRKKGIAGPYTSWLTDASSIWVCFIKYRHRVVLEGHWHLVSETY